MGGENAVLDDGRNGKAVEDLPQQIADNVIERLVAAITVLHLNLLAAGQFVAAAQQKDPAGRENLHADEVDETLQVGSRLGVGVVAEEEQVRRVDEGKGAKDGGTETKQVFQRSIQVAKDKTWGVQLMLEKENGFVSENT